MTTTLTPPVTPSSPVDNPWVLFTAPDGSGIASSPEVGTQQVTGNTGTRLVRLLATPLTSEQIRLRAEVLVRTGELLLAATHDTDPSPEFRFLASPTWQPLDEVVSGPIDQIVAYLGADGSEALLRSVSVEPVALVESPTTPDVETAHVDVVAGTSPEAADPADTPASSPAPLIAFDPNGSASVISYQVPEPTSYTGKHVLALDYDLDFFAGVVPATPPAQLAARRAAAAQGSSSLAPASLTAGSSSPSIADSVVLPDQVVASDSSDPTAFVVHIAPFPLTDRMGKLCWADVALIAAAGKRVEVFRSVSGQLDYRIRPVPGTPSASGVIAPAASTAIRPAIWGEGDPPPIDDPTNPVLTASITSPASQPPLAGPWNGLSLTVSGRGSRQDTSPTAVRVTVSDAGGTVVSSADGSWSQDGTRAYTWRADNLLFVTSGTYTVAVTVSGTGVDTDAATAKTSVSVQLASPPAAPPPTPPSVAPTLTLTTPAYNAVYVDPDGTVLVQVSGVVDTNGGSAAAVSFALDGAGPVAATLTPIDARTSNFTGSSVVSGAGLHAINVTATNADGVSAPPLHVAFRVAESPLIQPIDRRIVLIEKLGITSLLGNFGASRVVKTFSLLPGELTTITVDTYTKTDTTTKDTSSILDSASTECAADFEDTLSAESDSKATSSDATTLGIEAKVGANWGWGSAGIKANYSAQANAARENTTKNVQNAVAKHASKASSNRNVTVNTEFSTTESNGNTTDTSRTLKNINVSRVLNVVFRQLTQQHIVVVHLVDASIGYYTRDALLDANLQPQKDAQGNIVTQENYGEYTLPEIAGFAAANLADPNGAAFTNDVLNVLSTVPDYQGVQRSLIEQVVPKSSNGTDDTKNTYVRVIPDLSQTFTVPDGGPTYTVPGIVLNQSACVMRTDQLLCDALLGEGDALDEYSHALQDIAIAERQAQLDAVVAATKRELLAQQIVSSKDPDLAKAWAQIFPPPLSVPATITIPAGESS